MTRIIPEELNKILKKEYKLRFFTLLFFLIAFAICANVIFVSSSYLLLHLYEKAYATNISNNSETLKLNEELEKKITNLHALSRKIDASKKSSSVQVVDTLFSYTKTGVSIQAVEILEDSKITIRGVADTRQDLISLQNSLQKTAMFKDFSVPVESLARQKEVAFNVTFTYYEN